MLLYVYYMYLKWVLSLIHKLLRVLDASMKLKEFTSSSEIDHSSVLQKAWQICGDSHCQSAKLSDSLGSHIEDYQLENSEDLLILSAATRTTTLSKKGSIVSLFLDWSLLIPCTSQRKNV